MSDRGQWKSEFGFVLAAVGSAIGLGNIWRFSYMAYENGGGAFMIPYIFALLTAGIPLLILEFGIGHERIGSAPLAFAKINRRWEWLGWWAVIFVMFGIVLYYTVIIAWCLNFFKYSFTLAWGDDTQKFFLEEFLQLSDSPFPTGNVRTPIIVSLAIIWFLNWAIVYRGVQKGIETANKIFMPLLFILTAILVFWSLTLDGAGAGIEAYLKPDFSKITKPKVWIDAYSQIFFTLSLGFGIMITYASYLPAKSNITKSAFTIALINSGFSIFAGLATFSVLGYMALQQGVNVDDVVKETIILAFVAYPKAMTLLPGGNVFGAIFFFSLVVAGLSSSISIIEAFVSAVVDKFGVNRQALITYTAVFGFLGSVVFTTQSGLLWLDIVDHFITTYGLIVVGILECILVGWLFKFELIKKHINKVSSIHVGTIWGFLIRFFVPVILLIILIFNLVTELSQPYENYSWTSLILIGRDWLLATLVAGFLIASRPWKTERHKEEGRAS
ncbi:MAG: sodium-dependent transporter [Proteobacteria bacterium]|nr:sodium-dependent transporter [Pseudomonadota bacterium]